MKKKRLTRETILVCAILALCTAIGIFLLGLAIIGVDLGSINPVHGITSFSALSFLIWGGLLYGNC